MEGRRVFFGAALDQSYRPLVHLSDLHVFLFALLRLLKTPEIFKTLLYLLKDFELLPKQVIAVADRLLLRDGGHVPRHFFHLASRHGR